MTKEKRTVLETTFKNMETKYSNQTMVQGTDMDMAIAFGIVGINEEGKDISDYHTNMRMSHAQFKALIEHCNVILKQMESESK